MGGAGHGVLLLAEQAGHGEIHPVPHQVNANGRLAAGAGQLPAGGSQLEHGPLQDHRLAAGRAEKRDGSLCIFYHNSHLRGRIPLCVLQLRLQVGLGGQVDLGGIVVLYHDFLALPKGKNLAPGGEMEYTGPKR